MCRTREMGELQTCQSFTLDHAQIFDLLEDQTVQLRNTCNFADCCKEGTDHVVSIKLDRSSHNRVLVNDMSSQISEGHTHVGYKHWFLIRSDTSELVSLSVSSLDSLVGALKKCKQCKLYVLMLNCDSVLEK